MGKDKNISENTIASFTFFILLLLTLYTPFSILTLFLLSVPFIYLCLRNDNNIFLILFFINLVVALVIGSVVALFLTILAGSVGFAMGKLYKRTNLLSSLLIGVVLTLANIIIILVLSNIFLDVNISNSYNLMLQNSLDSSEEIFNQLGELQSEQLLIQYEEFIETASLLLPFFFIVISVVYVFVNHFFASIIINKLGFLIPKFPPFREWVFPRSIIYYYFIVSLIYLISPNIYFLDVITMNLYPLLTIILLIQGLSFIFYYSHYKQMSKALSIIALITIFIPILNQIIQVIGIADLVFNLRKKLK